MQLSDFINKHFDGIQLRFAEFQGVKKQQVTQWIAKYFIVINWVLYSPRRALVVAGIQTKKAQPLSDFIYRNHGAMQRKFAEAEGVTVAQVNRWIECGFIVLNGTIYSPRRELNKLN